MAIFPFSFTMNTCGYHFAFYDRKCKRNSPFSQFVLWFGIENINRIVLGYVFSFVIKFLPSEFFSYRNVLLIFHEQNIDFTQLYDVSDIKHAKTNMSVVWKLLGSIEYQGPNNWTVYMLKTTRTFNLHPH